MRYDSFKARLAKHGGTSRELAILLVVMPIIGRTDAEAKKQLDRLQSWLSPASCFMCSRNVEPSYSERNRQLGHQQVDVVAERAGKYAGSIMNPFADPERSYSSRVSAIRFGAP